MTDTPTDTPNPTAIPTAAAPAEPAVPSFDSDFDSAAREEENRPIVLELRREELRFVPAITVVDREKLRDLRRSGDMTVGDVFRFMLLDDREVERFYAINDNRANPVPDAVLGEMIEHLMSIYSGGKSTGKPTR